MGERIRLPDGRVIVLPEGMSAEEREAFMSKLEVALAQEATAASARQESPAAPARQGSSQGIVLPWQEGYQGPEPSSPSDEVPPSRRAPTPTSEDTGGRTALGGIATLGRSIPIGVAQAGLLAKQAVLAATSLDEDTQAEKDNRKKLNDLLLKIDPAYRDSNWAQVGMGLGTLAGMAVPAVATAGAAPLLGASALAASGYSVAASALSGALMNAGSYASETARYEEETGEDVGAGKEALGLLASGAIGLSEALPMARLGKGVTRALNVRRAAAKSTTDIAIELAKGKAPESIGAIARSAARQAFEEGRQEAAQGFGNSLVARALYDDEALVGSVGAAFEEAFVGGEVGAIADLAMNLTTYGLTAKSRRAMRNLRLASKHISKAEARAVQDGGVDSEIPNEWVTITELDENGEYLDNSTEAQAFREGLRFDEDSRAVGQVFNSDFLRAAEEVNNSTNERIRAEHQQTMDESSSTTENQKAAVEKRDRELKAQAELNKQLRLAMKLAANDIHKAENDGENLLQQEVDAALAEQKKANSPAAATELLVEKVEEVQSEQAKRAEAKAAADDLPTGTEGSSTESEPEAPVIDQATERLLSEINERLDEQAATDAVAAAEYLESGNSADVVQSERDSSVTVAAPPTVSIGVLYEQVRNGILPRKQLLKEEESTRLEREETRTEFTVRQLNEDRDRYFKSLADPKSTEAESVTEEMAGVEKILKTKPMLDADGNIVDPDAKRLEEIKTELNVLANQVTDVDPLLDNDPVEEQRQVELFEAMDALQEEQEGIGKRGKKVSQRDKDAKAYVESTYRKIDSPEGRKAAHVERQVGRIGALLELLDGEGQVSPEEFYREAADGTRVEIKDSNRKPILSLDPESDNNPLESFPAEGDARDAYKAILVETAEKKFFPDDRVSGDTTDRVDLQGRLNSAEQGVALAKLADLVGKDAQKELTLAEAHDLIFPVLGGGLVHDVVREKQLGAEAVVRGETVEVSYKNTFRTEQFREDGSVTGNVSKVELDAVEEPVSNQYDENEVKRIMIRILNNRKKKAPLADDASMDAVQTEWRKGKPKKELRKGNRKKGPTWDYDYLKKILGEDLTDGQIEGLVPAFIESGTAKQVVQGANLFMAMKGGPPRIGKKTRPTGGTLHMVKVLSGQTAPGTDITLKLLKDKFGTDAVTVFARVVETEATPREQVANEIPFTPRPEAVQIKNELLESLKAGTEIPISLIEKAMALRGLAKVENGKVVVEPNFIEDFVEETIGVDTKFADLDKTQRLSVLARVLSSPTNEVLTNKQPSVATSLTDGQMEVALAAIRDAGDKGVNVVRGDSAFFKRLKESSIFENLDSKDTNRLVKKVRSFVKNSALFEQVGTTNYYKFRTDPTAGTAKGEARVTAEQPKEAEKKVELLPVIDEGQERNAEKGGEPYDATREEIAEELVRAEKLVEALKVAARNRAIQIFGKKKGSTITIEIEAAYDSIYEKYVSKLSNRSTVAYVDTAAEAIILNISNLTKQYETKQYETMEITPELLANDAMVHEGVHYLLLKEGLSPQEIRNLTLYGERNLVPEAVSKDAVNPTDKSRMNWKQWVASQPAYSELSTEEQIQEMQVQILDALALNQIPKEKSAGAIGNIKRRVADLVTVLTGVSDTGSLASIASVYNKMQDNVEVARRLQVAEESGLAELRFVDRANENDLRQLVQAIKNKDQEEIKKISNKIYTDRAKGGPEVSPAQQFINEISARRELDDTPHGVVSMLNGEAFAAGRINPAALDEYFRIQSGKAPYVMSEPRRRELARTTANAPSASDQKFIDYAANKGSGRSTDGPAPSPSLLDSLLAKFSPRNTFSEDTLETGDNNPPSIEKGWRADKEKRIDDLPQGWELALAARIRSGVSDRRTTQLMTSLEAKAFRKSRKKTIEGYMDMGMSLDSMTAWRYNDQSQSFLQGILNYGPIEVLGSGFQIVRNRELDLEELVYQEGLDGGDGGPVVVLSEGGKRKTRGMHALFRKFSNSTIMVATEVGNARRKIAARGERNRVQVEFVEEMVQAGFDRSEITKILNDLGPLPKGKSVRPPDSIKDDSDLSKIWSKYVGSALKIGQIGYYQLRYDAADPPESVTREVDGKKVKFSREDRFREDVAFLREIKEAADNEPNSEAARVLEFWEGFRVNNAVTIEQAFKAGLIDERRRDLALRSSFMPFYRDLTGSSDASPLGMSQDQKDQDQSFDPEDRERQVLDEKQRVADRRAKMGRTLSVPSVLTIDRNVEGSVLPLSPDLIGSIVKNQQAMIRDIMWNIAAVGTVDEGVEMNTIYEQRFITKDNISEEMTEEIEKKRKAAEDARNPWKKLEKTEVDEHGKFQYKEAYELAYEMTGEAEGITLHTPQALDLAEFGEFTIRIKKNGENRYYRTQDDHLAQATMAINATPSETIRSFFEDQLYASPKVSKGLTKLLIGASGVLRDAVTLSPVFQNVNVMRDSMQASVTFGGGPPLVMAAFKNFYFGEMDRNKMVWDPELQDGKGDYRRVKKLESGKYEEGEGVYERAQRAGLSVAIDYVKDPEKAFEEGQRILELGQDLNWDVRDPLEFTKNALWSGPLKALKRSAAQSEIATRMAVYDRVMDATNGDHGKAYTQALEIINYGRRGNNPVIGAFMAMNPFMAGRLQGMDVMWRTHWGHVDVPGLNQKIDEKLDPDRVLRPERELETEYGKVVVRDRASYQEIMFEEGNLVTGLRGRRVRQTFARGMVLVTATAMYTFWRYDDEDYQDAREDQKNDYWIFPWGARIPIPFEVGTIYKVIPEQIIRMILETEHDASDVAEEVKRQLRSSLAVSAVPQLFRPAADAIRNKDAYQKDDIVPQWMSDSLLSTEQLRSNTSYVARGLSLAMSKIPLVNNMDFLTSPMKMEYMLRQQFGTLGAYAITTADAVYASSMGLNRAGTAYNFGLSSLYAPFVGDDIGDYDIHGNRFNVAQRMAQEWNRIPILGDLLYDPRSGGGYQEDFYEWIEYLDSVVATLGQVEERDPERAKSIEDANRVLLRHKDTMRHYESQMTHWRDDRDYMLERSDLSREEKNRRLVYMEQRRNVMLSDMKDIMSDVKAIRTPSDLLRSIGIKFSSGLDTP